MFASFWSKTIVSGWQVLVDNGRRVLISKKSEDQLLDTATSRMLRPEWIKRIGFDLWYVHDNDRCGKYYELINNKKPDGFVYQLLLRKKNMKDCGT